MEEGENKMDEKSMDASSPHRNLHKIQIGSSPITRSVKRRLLSFSEDPSNSSVDLSQACLTTISRNVLKMARADSDVSLIPSSSQICSSFDPTKLGDNISCKSPRSEITRMEPLSSTCASSSFHDSPFFSGQHDSSQQNIKRRLTNVRNRTVLKSSICPGLARQKSFKNLLKAFVLTKPVINATSGGLLVHSGATPQNNVTSTSNIDKDCFMTSESTVISSELGKRSRIRNSIYRDSNSCKSASNIVWRSQSSLGSQETDATKQSKGISGCAGPHQEVNGALLTSESLTKIGISIANELHREPSSLQNYADDGVNATSSQNTYICKRNFSSKPKVEEDAIRNVVQELVNVCSEKLEGLTTGEPESACLCNHANFLRRSPRQAKRSEAVKAFLCQKPRRRSLSFDLRSTSPSSLQTSKPSSSACVKPRMRRVSSSLLQANYGSFLDEKLELKKLDVANCRQTRVNDKVNEMNITCENSLASESGPPQLPASQNIEEYVPINPDEKESPTRKPKSVTVTPAVVKTIGRFNISPASDHMVQAVDNLPTSDFNNGPGKLETRSEVVKRQMTHGLLSQKSNCSPRKKKIRFKGVQVFYFGRTQNFNTVPDSPGVSLGMEGKHHSSKSFGLNEFESISRLQHKPVIDECALSGKMEERSVRKDDVIFERSKEISKSCADAIMALDEFEDLCDDFDDCEESEHEEGLGVLDNDDFNEVNEAHATRFDHQTIDARERRNMLKSAGVKVDKSEAAICRKIRESRLKCGCECTNGVCMPSTCRCSIDGVECLVDNPPFPCSCKASTCNNPAGRVEFDVARVRAHFISTMMRLRALDKMNFAAEEVCSPTHTRFFDECYAGKNEASCSTSLAKNECHSTSSSSPQSSSVWPDRTKKESSGSPSENDTNACSFTEKNSGSNYEEACSKHANESSALFDQVDEQFQTPPAKLRQIYPVTPVYKTFSSVVTETEHSY